MTREHAQTMFKRWWHKSEFWLVVAVLVTSAFVIGYQVALYNAQRMMTVQLAEIRQEYDNARADQSAQIKALVAETINASQTASQAAQVAAEAVNIKGNDQ